MIHVNLQISSPWSNFFKAGRVWTGNLSTHKFWELQIMRTHDVICVRAEVTHRQDHAGVSFEFGLLSFNVAFTVYDHRHWNHIEKEWEHYE